MTTIVDIRRLNVNIWTRYFLWSERDRRSSRRCNLTLHTMHISTLPFVLEESNDKCFATQEVVL